MQSHLIESLNARIVFDATFSPLPVEIATMDNHHRLIVITDDTAQNYSVTQSATRIFVTDLDANAQASFPNSKVRKIVVHLNDGDDKITFDTSTPVLCRGDYGNDTIIGGNENDDFYGDYGDYGDDRLYGGAGNDYLNGGKGADALYAGIGTDTLFGGKGADRLYSSEGVDDAADIVEGGGGQSVDRFFVSANDIVTRRRQDEVTIS